MCPGIVHFAFACFGVNLSRKPVIVFGSHIVCFIASYSSSWLFLIVFLILSILEFSSFYEMSGSRHKIQRVLGYLCIVNESIYEKLRVEKVVIHISWIDIRWHLFDVCVNMAYGVLILEFHSVLQPNMMHTVHIMVRLYAILSKVMAILWTNPFRIWLLLLFVAAMFAQDGAFLPVVSDLNVRPNAVVMLLSVSVWIHIWTESNI